MERVVTGNRNRLSFDDQKKTERIKSALDDIDSVGLNSWDFDVTEYTFDVASSLLFLFQSLPLGAYQHRLFHVPRIGPCRFRGRFRHERSFCSFGNPVGIHPPRDFSVGVFFWIEVSFR